MAVFSFAFVTLSLDLETVLLDLDAVLLLLAGRERLVVEAFVRELLAVDFAVDRDFAVLLRSCLRVSWSWRLSLSASYALPWVLSMYDRRHAAVFVTSANTRWTEFPAGIRKSFN